MRYIFLFSVLLFTLSFQLSAQDCGTTISQSEAVELERLLSSSGSNQRSALLNVEVEIPIKFHSVRRSDGSGGLTVTQKDELMNQINSYYARSNISFYHVDDINYIDKDDGYNLDSSSEGIVTAGNTESRTINVYFTGSLSSNGNPVCGYTRFPPSADHIFVAYGCVLNGNTTLEHELGHYFTLYHTHGTTNTGTTDELVNQSNCQSAGDRLCDTPADPNLSGVVNNDCVYVGTARDANDETYSPDESNIMSYSRDQCQNKFSGQQYERIRSGFENGRSYLNYRTDNFLATMRKDQSEACIYADVNFFSNAFGATKWSWEFEGGTPATSSSQNPTVFYENSGIFNVTLTVESNAGEIFILNKNNYVRVIDPLDNSTRNSISFNNVANSSFQDFFEVENPDEALTFELDNIVIDGEESSVIKMNNYDYLSDVPSNADLLKTIYLNNEGVKNYQIDFKYAYAFRAGSLENDVIKSPVYDTLSVLIENQCGALPIIVNKTGGENLATAESTTEKFVPTANSDFASFSYNYTVGEGEDFIRVMLESMSYNGNNLYIKEFSVVQDYTVDAPSNFRFVQKESDSLLFRWVDNSNNETSFVVETSEDGENFTEFADLGKNVQRILVDQDDLGSATFLRLKARGFDSFESEYTDVVELNSSILSIEQSYEEKLLIYPNPVANSLSIESLALDFSGYYELVSPQGTTLLEGPITENSQIDLSAINSGIIFVRIYDKSNQFLTIKKLIKL